jgi:hypothetical protein
MGNEILEEIWRTRREIEDAENGDIRKVFRAMKKKTSESSRARYSGKIRKKPATKSA